MRRIQIIGLALVAAFALSAVMAAAASAAGNPEFKSSSSFPIKFSSPLTKNPTFLETEKNGQVKCSELESKGELAGAREAKEVVVTFKGCEVTGFGGGKCNTAGKGTGIIETEKLFAKPVFIEKLTNLTVKQERGLDVFPKEAKGKFAEFSCSTLIGTETLKVEGASGTDSVIGTIAEAEDKVSLNKVKIDFDETKGVQSPSEYEEEVGGVIKPFKDFLETEGKGAKTFAKEKSGEEAEETIEFAGGAKVELS